MPVDGVVQKSNRCEDRDRRVPAPVQRDPTSFESQATDPGGIQTTTVINQQPGKGHLLSYQWTEESRQVSWAEAKGSYHGLQIGCGDTEIGSTMEVEHVSVRLPPRMDNATMLEYTARSMTGDLAELTRIIRDIRIALLTTVGREGQFHTRPVQTLKVEADATLWFFTDWTSPKVTELHHDVRVSLGYADLAKNVYVALSGEGSLVRDPQKAKELWSIEQRAYYPKGPDDERLAPLRVPILHAEYWIAPGRTSYIIAAARAGVTGIPAGVIGEDHKVK